MLNKIEDIIIELNSNLPEDYDHSACFAYETTGYCDAVTFGNEVLWDSENHHQIDELPDFIAYIKNQYNKYIDTLKCIRFMDIKALSDKIDGAHDAVDDIIEDISGRKGIGNEWEQIDDDTQDEIVTNWVNIVKKYS